MVVSKVHKREKVGWEPWMTFLLKWDFYPEQNKTFCMCLLLWKSFSITTLCVLWLLGYLDFHYLKWVFLDFAICKLRSLYYRRAASFHSQFPLIEGFHLLTLWPLGFIDAAFSTHQLWNSGLWFAHLFSFCGTATSHVQPLPGRNMDNQLSVKSISPRCKVFSDFINP